MCGIAGIAALGPGSATAPDERARVAAMCAALVHRGPDEDGFDAQGGVTLGMRRLSIIDVAGGHQPYASEDGSVVAVFNGEIYNFRELRRELERDGHRPASDADGEVLVHLWEEHGPRFVERLNGMFAIALHDRRRRRLLLARDRIGIKPLYVWRGAERLVFGSEIKALLASGLVPRALDHDALAELLAWEYVPGPRTLLAGVRKLPPGTLLEIDLGDGRGEERTWWNLPPAGEADAGTDDDETWVERVDHALRRAVGRQLVADVPLGAFLSGGVDSSLVVDAMGPGASTFAIGFEDPSYDERRWASRVAEHLGVRHRAEVQRPEILELFERLMPQMDDPIGDFSIFPTYLVSRLARREVTVALTGDGGDELFGGYDTYAAERMARTWSKIPLALRRGVIEPIVARLRPRPEKKGPVNLLRRFVEGASHDPRLGHARWRLFADEALRRALFTPEALARLSGDPERHVRELDAAAAGRGDVDRGLWIDLRSYLVDNCLVKVDRMSMACSLEARVPLLDHELVELAFRVPERLKVDGRRTKPLLRRLAARVVPRDCVERPKQGFSIPIKQWLDVELRPLADELLDPERLAADGIFRPATVARLREEHAAGRANHSHVLWTLIVFGDWRRRWAV